MESFRQLFTKIWEGLKSRFIANGGWKSKLNILYLFLGMWSFYTFIKVKGWLPKKSVYKKHIFITGAGSGLGRAMAQRFAKLGANLSLVDLNFAGLEETKKLIKAETGRDDNVNIKELDVSKRENVSKVTKEMEQNFGSPFIVINNAGIMQNALVTDMNERMASKVMVVNCESNFWIVRDFLPGMMARNEGQIVTISSACGIAAVPRLTDYAASKFAAVGFSEGLRAEMSSLSKNITCTTICPYFINTGMFEGVNTGILYPLLETDVVVNRCMTAILQNEGEITIPWSVGVIVHMTKSLFPSDFQVFVTWALVGLNTMDKVAGRQIPSDLKN